MIETVTVPMTRVEEVCDGLLHHLQEKKEVVSYAQLGAAMMLCRLSYVGDGLPSPEVEVKFIQDMMDWLSAYWGADGSLTAN